VTRLLLASYVLVAAFAPLPAYAAGAALAVSPDSGGPGSMVTLTGSGFCSRPGCGKVAVLAAGRPFAPEQAVSPSGGFTVKTQVSGGYTPGTIEIQARQVLDDGGELTASAQFTYAPSKGEEAEREAETRDRINNLANPSAAVASPKGVPLASFAAGASSAPATAAAGGSVGRSTGPATAAARDSTPAGRAEGRSRGGRLLAGLGIVAGAFGIALAVRRRRRPADLPGGVTT
jgi:hypothetical protein